MTGPTVILVTALFYFMRVAVKAFFVGFRHTS